MLSFRNKNVILSIALGSMLASAAHGENAKLTQSNTNHLETTEKSKVRGASKTPETRRKLGKGKSKCNLVPFDLPDVSELGGEVHQYDPDKKKSKKLTDNGLGKDSINKYAWSSALDDHDDLYVGTFNANFNLLGVRAFEENLEGPESFLNIWSGSPLMYSEGGAIYKQKKKGNFKQVLKASNNHVGFRKGINHMGKMYFGSSNSETGAKIFTNQYSEDSDEFKILNDSFTLHPNDVSIRAMCTSSHSGHLYIGTENVYDGPAIISYDGDSSWERWDDEGIDFGFAVAECTELSVGKMLFGTWNGGGYNLVVYDEVHESFSELDLPDHLDHNTNGVMELRVWNGYLYVGLLSYEDGFALIRTDTETISWEIITEDGFYQEQIDQIGLPKAKNPYPWSSAVVNGKYYIGTFAGVLNRGVGMGGNPLDLFDSRAQLWSSTDGTEWMLEEHDAFGEEFTYGFRTMQATSKGDLYIGTASHLFLPDISRPPYTDYFGEGLSGDLNKDICEIIDRIEEFGI